MGVTLSAIASVATIAEASTSGINAYHTLKKFFGASPNANNPTVQAILEENERSESIRKQLAENAEKARRAHERLQELERKSQEKAEQQAKEANERASKAEAEINRLNQRMVEQLEKDKEELKRKAQEDKEESRLREKEIREAAELKARLAAEKKSHAEKAKQEAQAEELRKLKEAKEKRDKAIIANTAAVWKDVTVESKNKRAAEKVEDSKTGELIEVQAKETETAYSDANSETLPEESVLEDQLPQSEPKVELAEQPLVTENENADPEQPTAGGIIRKPESEPEFKLDAQVVHEEKSLATPELNKKVIDNPDKAESEADKITLAKMEAQNAIEEAERVEKELQAQVASAKGSLPIGFRLPTTEELKAAKKAMKYDKELLHFAVCGPSGSGKSSLINALRGIPKGHRSAAETGENETTLKVSRYPDPRKGSPYKRFVWYDIPGAGTPSIPTSWEYFHKFGLYCFDFIILVYGERFTTIDAEIIKHCKLFNIPFFMVRSKSDEKIRSMLIQHPYGPEGDGFADSAFDFRNEEFRNQHEEAKDLYAKKTRDNFKENLERLSQEYKGEVFTRLVAEMGGEKAIKHSLEDSEANYINPNEPVYILSSLNLERIIGNHEYDQLVKEQTAAIQSRPGEPPRSEPGLSVEILGKAIDKSTQFKPQLKSADDPPIDTHAVSSPPTTSSAKSEAVHIELVVQPISIEDLDVQSIFPDNKLDAETVVTTEPEKDSAIVSISQIQVQEDETWEKIGSSVEDSLAMGLNEEHFQHPPSVNINKSSPSIWSANPAVTFDAIGVATHMHTNKPVKLAKHGHGLSRIAAQAAPGFKKPNLKKPKPVQTEKLIDEQEFIAIIIQTALDRRYQSEKKEVSWGYGYSLAIPNYGTAKKARNLVYNAGSAVKSKVQESLYTSSSTKSHSSAVGTENVGGHGVGMTSSFKKPLLRRATGDKSYAI